MNNSRFSAFLNENMAKTLYIFDFDDTLATTDSRVVDITSKKELTTAEYDLEKRKNPNFDSNNYDFSQFDVMMNPDMIEKTLNRLIMALNEGHSAVILTARANSEPVRTLLLQKYRIFIPVIAINEPKYGHLGKKDGEKKANWIKNQIEEGFTRIFFYDDSKNNIKAVQELRNDPEIAEKAVIDIIQVKNYGKKTVFLHKEEEKFQKKVKKKHFRMKNKLIQRGKQPNKPPYSKKVSSKRAKSAPPGAGGT